MPIQSFRDLTVWQKSFYLAKKIYLITDKLPKAEQFGLTSQIRRCAISIPSNIAEGQQRHNLKEYRQFIGIALGSAAELETQLLLVQEIYKISTAQLVQEIHEIQKMLFVLSQKLQPKT